MVTGRVLKYDEARGYGFVAPDTGGEDVFIHVNDLDFDKTLLATGARIDFSVEESGRGLKASNIQLVEPAPARAPERRTHQPATEIRSVDDGLCDVLTAREFTEEITEGLLSAAPSVTGADILRIRQYFVKLAHGHGWIEG